MELFVKNGMEGRDELESLEASLEFLSSIGSAISAFFAKIAEFFKNYLAVRVVQ